MSHWYSDFPKYVSVAKKKADAEKKIKQLMKKDPNLKPVIIEGRAIAATWWGKAWNTNLEGYADYRNRIDRGRSYVRNGMVLDLQIEQGKVRSLVQGSASSPYSVVINIRGIGKESWRLLKGDCARKIDSLQGLLSGNFPKELSTLFTAHGTGLFPSPQDIEFDCSCPDYASMCKHVAAALYGIGARLDDDPSLFFKLREVEMKELITEAVKDKTSTLLKKAEKKSLRVLDHSDISSLFGIEMEKAAVKPKPVKKKIVVKSIRKKGVVRKKVKKVEKKGK